MDEPGEREEEKDRHPEHEVGQERPFEPLQRSSVDWLQSHDALRPMR